MEKIGQWISDNALIVAGAVFAFAISILTRREGSIIDRLSGAVLCSIMSTGIFYGISAVFPQCPQEAAVAIGSFVGFYGVDEVKKLILQRVRQLLGSAGKARKNNDSD